MELTLRNAGGEGWGQVYKVRAYYAPFTAEAYERTVENLRRYCPDHQPLFTGVEVKALYAGMGVEFEVEAHVGG
ncbi:hypothetical protein IMZ48_26565 [Candidatus Bathyarchaeota archaeon]|nr:hypothetical protein [Candidatus Bathyarchaeota archaeon]